MGEHKSITFQGLYTCLWTLPQNKPRASIHHMYVITGSEGHKQYCWVLLI